MWLPPPEGVEEGEDGDDDGDGGGRKDGCGAMLRARLWRFTVDLCRRVVRGYIAREREVEAVAVEVAVAVASRLLIGNERPQQRDTAALRSRVSISIC